MPSTVTLARVGAVHNVTCVGAPGSEVQAVQRGRSTMDRKVLLADEPETQPVQPEVTTR